MTPRRNLLVFAIVLLLNLLPLSVLSTGVLSSSSAVQQPPTLAPTATPLPSPAPDDGWRERERGLVTWYDGPTSLMRNGEELDLGGLTCAVDAADWDALQGRMVRIRRQDGTGEPIVVRVTDSGYLKAAGRFVWDSGLARYVPSAVPDEGQSVIVDLPRGTHQRYFEGQTVPIILEVQEGAPTPTDGR